MDGREGSARERGDDGPDRLVRPWLCGPQEPRQPVKTSGSAVWSQASMLGWERRQVVNALCPHDLQLLERCWLRAVASPPITRPSKEVGGGQGPAPHRCLYGQPDTIYARVRLAQVATSKGSKSSALRAPSGGRVDGAISLAAWGPMPNVSEQYEQRWTIEAVGPDCRPFPKLPTWRERGGGPLARR
jgi:hypothetical protein